MFRDGEHLVVFNEQNVVDLLDRYLRDERLREGIAAAGHREAQEYTVMKQAGRLLEVACEFQQLHAGTAAALPDGGRQAEGDSPIFAAKAAVSKEQVLSAAKIGTVPLNGYAAEPAVSEARQRLILGIGTGQCGLRALAAVLNRQPCVQSSYQEAPWLPWQRRQDARRVLAARFERFRRNARPGRLLLANCASFYLPYLEDVIALEPDVRVVCLKRPRGEVVAGFCRWLDENTPLPTNHWARQPAAGWHHEVNRTRIYPQYDTQVREEGIGRYWDEYYQRAEELARRYPQHVRVFDSAEVLGTEGGLGQVLGFAGVQDDGRRATDDGRGAGAAGADNSSFILPPSSLPAILQSLPPSMSLNSQTPKSLPLRARHVGSAGVERPDGPAEVRDPGAVCHGYHPALRAGAGGVGAAGL